MASKDIFTNKNNEENYDYSILDKSNYDTYGLNTTNQDVQSTGTEPLASEIERLSTENLNITYTDNIGDDTESMLSSPLLFNQASTNNQLLEQQTTDFNQKNTDLDNTSIDFITGNNNDNPLVGTLEKDEYSNSSTEKDVAVSEITDESVGVLDTVGLNNGDVTNKDSEELTSIDNPSKLGSSWFDPPKFTSFSLVNDTAPDGTNNTDRITYDPTIRISVPSPEEIYEWKAGFNNTSENDYVDIYPSLQSNGVTIFDRTQLETIYGGAIPDDLHTLRLLTRRDEGSTQTVSSETFSFILDTTAPAQPVFDLEAASDTGSVGDKQTDKDIVTLVGQTDANVTVILEETGETTTASDNGEFIFSNVSLEVGDNSFTVKVNDIAGNEDTFSTVVTRLDLSAGIILNNNTVAENSATETVIGQFESTDPNTENNFTYTLVNNTNNPPDSNEASRFKIVGSELLVADETLFDFEANAQHTIEVNITDSDGNSTIQQFTIEVTNVNEAPSFTSNPEYTGESGSEYTYNITTTDPDAGDTKTITGNNLPLGLTLTDNGDGSATLSGTPTNTTDGINSSEGLYNIDLTVTDADGLSAIQSFIISTVPNFSLSEATNFTPNKEIKFVIPQNPSILNFKINDAFDTTDLDSINDAFEVALVDANGKSLVHTFSKDKDAFFNLTEGENAALGAGTTYNAADGTISLNLTGINPGEEAKLIFRLVNNDSDTATNVTISDLTVEIAPIDTSIPTQSQFDSSPRSSEAPNFNLLTDVSDSFSAEYNRTTYNADTKLLYTDIAIRNDGSYSVDAPLIVAVTNISDPSVILRNPEGLTPEGIPYYNFSNLVADGKLNPEELTTERSLVFYNPIGKQFTYDLQVLAEINAAPVIESEPELEIIGGKQYQYRVEATDKNDDAIAYELLTSPEGMSIDAETGLITWDTTTDNIGNQNVVVQVSDSRGRTDTQEFNLAVIETPPNRPPIFKSTPVVNAAINTEYKYDADATDADLDDITYSLPLAPEGMTIDPETGEITWTPKVQTVFGDTISGQITNPGTSNVYTFGAIEGERIYFDPLKSSGDNSDWNLQIIGPSGQFVVTDNFESGVPFDITETGNYRLSVTNNNNTTGKYGFSLIDLWEIPTASNNQEITTELLPVSEDDLYRFNAKAGQRLYFDTLSDNSNLDWTIYSADNQKILSGGWNDTEILLPNDGEYILALQGKDNLDSSVPYSFQITTPDININLDNLEDLDTEIDGILDAGYSTHLYQFSGTAGQQLYLDTLIADRDGTWTLYNSDNQEISSTNLNSDFEVELLDTDTYTLLIQGNNNNPVDYKFKIITQETQVETATISSNGIISGEIKNKGEKDIYTFTGRTGESVFLDALIDTPNISAQLLSPKGVSVFDEYIAADENRNPVVLTESGTYQLIIDGEGETVGNYNAKLLSFDDAVSFTLGSSKQGTLDPNSEVDLYRFTGYTNSRVYFDSLIDSPNGEWLLYGTKNQLIKSESLSKDFEQVLREYGTYYLMLRSDGSTSTVSSTTPIDYEFQAVSSTASSSSLSLGSTINASIGRVGEQDVYRFSGSVGQKLYFDAINGSSDITAKLVSPSGLQVWSGDTSNDSLPITLLEAGTYSLTFDGNADTTGNYSFRLNNLATTSSYVENLSFNSLRSGSIYANQTRLYKFNGQAGERLNFDSQQEIANAEWVLYAPNKLLDDNLVVARASLNEDFEVLLPTDGTYFLALSNSGDTTASFKFLVSEIAGNEVTNSGLGVVRSGTVNTGEIIDHTFTANAGTLIYFDSQIKSENSENVSVKLVDSNNSEVNNFSAYSDSESIIQLQQSGTYTSSVIGQGDFRHQIIDLGNASTLSLNIANNVFLDTGYATQVYQFEGDAGDKLLYDALSFNDPNVTVRIITSSGREILTTSSPSDSELKVLEESGTYYLIINNNSDSITGIDFRLLNSATSLSLDSDKTGEFDTDSFYSYETDLYRFRGYKDQYLYFDAKEGDSTNTWTLYSPNGEKLTSNSIANDFELEVLETGDYILALQGKGSGQANYKFRVITPYYSSSGTSISFNSIYNRTIYEPGEKDTYRFTGRVGDNLFFDGISGTGEEKIQLISPSGKTIFNDIDIREDVDFFTLEEAGTYYAIVDGNQGTTGTYSFRFLTEPSSNNYSINRTTPITRKVYDNRTELYKFSGQAGQYINLKIDATGGDSDWKLLAAGNKVIAESENYQNQKILLDSDGSYILALSSGTSDTTYTFGIASPEMFDNPELINETITDEIDRYGQEDIYTFKGNAGQRLFFDSITGKEQIIAELIDPNGNKLFSQQTNTDSDKPLFIEETGDYRLVVKSNDSTTSNYSFRLVDLETVDELTLSTPINARLDSGTEVDFYKFNAKKGQRLTFDNSASQWNNADWVIYSPNNEIIAQPDPLNPDFEITPELAGTYLLAVRGDSSTPLNYEFKVIPTQFDNPITGDNGNNLIIVPGSGETRNVNTKPNHAYRVKVGATDGRGAKTEQSFKIRVNPEADNNAPIIVSEPTTRFGLNKTEYNYLIEGIDSDNDSLIYSLIDAPNGAIVNPNTGKITWSPQTAGNYDFKVGVTDGRGGFDTQNFSVNVEEELGEIRGFTWLDSNLNGIPDTNLVRGSAPDILFAIDISGSTGGRNVDWSTANLDDYKSNTNLSILDTEIAGVIAFNKQLIEQRSW